MVPPSSSRNEWLHEGEERLAAILEQLPVAIAVVEPGGRMALANRQWRKYLPDGLPSRDPRRAHRWRAFTDGHEPIPPGEWPGEEALAGRAVPGMNFLYTLDDGREVWLRMSSTPLRDHGADVVGAICIIEDIDARKRAELEQVRVAEALQESEAEFRGLFEQSAVGVALADAASGSFLRVNRRFCEITGRSESDLLATDYTEITHPEDRERNWAAIEPVVLGDAERWEIEKRYLRPDGGTVWVHVSGRVVSDDRTKPSRVIANAIDITARKSAEEALLASRRQLQAVTDCAPVQLANCSADYRFKFVNKAYAEWFGLQPDDFVGLSIREVLGEGAFRDIKPYADRALGGERSEYETEVQFKDMAEQWSRIAYAPELDDAGNVVGWVAAIISITDRKRAEEALREADRRKDEFLAVLGHELRNPLAPLSTALEVLQLAGNEPELIEHVRAMMERQVAHLVRLTDDLLDLSRISRGIVELQHAPLDLNAVIDAAVELSDTLIAERGHRLVLDRAKGPLPIQGDFQRLTQVFANLLGNAAKYTKPGGTIWLTTGVDKDHIEARVRDTGLGIPPQRLRELFQMFSQVPEHRELTGGGGLGIGLALSRQLVALHGGSIEAASEGLGRGSEFIVRLPRSATGAEAAAGKPPEEADAARRILVVDDNVDAAESLRMALELRGHTVRAAHSGPEALSAVESFRPNVVLLDIGLPEMDGHEIARRIRRMPGTEDLLLVAVTGWGQERDRQRSTESGFDHHLIKPVQLDALASVFRASRPEPTR